MRSPRSAAKKAPSKQQPEQRAVRSPGWSGLAARTRELLACAALAALVWMAFGQIIDHPPVNFDDHDYFTRNPIVLGGLNWEGVRFAFTTPMTANWHPATWLSYMTDVALFGPSVAAVRRTSVVLHAANAVLVFLLLRWLTGAFWRSAIVAALFAIHPLHVESVAWLSQRKEVLSGFFWLLTLLAWAQWAKQQTISRYAAAAAAAALAMMSKPSAVTIPFALLLLDYWPLARLKAVRDLGRLALEKIPFFAMSVAISVVTYLFQEDLGAMERTSTAPLALKLTNAVASYGAYLRQTIWPANLAVLYPFPESPPAAPAAVSAVVLIAITALAVRLGGTHRFLPAGWFWFLGVLVPMIGIVQVGIQSHADRYTYMPLLGLFWLIVWGLHDLAGTRRTSGAMQAAAAVVIALLLWRCWVQSRFWRDDLTLFTRTLEVTGDRNRLAHSVIGNAHLSARRLPDAERHLRRAVELDKTFAPSYRELSEALLGQGRAAEALAEIDKAIELAPDSQLNYYSRGIVLRALKRDDEAVAAFEKAIGMGLLDAEENRALREMGLARMRQERHVDAIPLFRRALLIEPGDFLSRKNLAFAHLKLSQYAEARAQFERLAQMNPADPDVRTGLRATAGK